MSQAINKALQGPQTALPSSHHSELALSPIPEQKPAQSAVSWAAL